MYVERGMEEIVRLKMEMGLCEEEEREFDEFVFAFKGESVFLIGFWFWGEGNFQVLGFWLFFFFF